ncbi:hypothetical protein C2E23DRAFT_885095 [Lenzites betulinus]|nr:hypothetical protein C2E23DRAFT_885095 [Lenzites betulinus]
MPSERTALPYPHANSVGADDVWRDVDTSSLSPSENEHLPPSDDDVGEPDSRDGWIPPPLVEVDTEGREWVPDPNYINDAQTMYGVRSTLVVGRAHLSLGHEGWLPVEVGSHIPQHFLLFERLKASGDHLSLQMYLPATLDAARAMTFESWEAKLEDARMYFDTLMDSEQRDAIKTLAYVHLWFSTGQGRDDNEANTTLWRQLQQILAFLASVCLLRATPAEELISNIRAWAQKEIEDGLPMYLRSPETRAEANGAGRVSPEPRLLSWDVPA